MFSYSFLNNPWRGYGKSKGEEVREKIWNNLRVRQTSGALVVCYQKFRNGSVARASAPMSGTGILPVQFDWDTFSMGWKPMLLTGKMPVPLTKFLSRIPAVGGYYFPS